MLRCKRHPKCLENAFMDLAQTSRTLRQVLVEQAAESDCGKKLPVPWNMTASKINGDVILLPWQARCQHTWVCTWQFSSLSARIVFPYLYLMLMATKLMLKLERYWPWNIQSSHLMVQPMELLLNSKKLHWSFFCLTNTNACSCFLLCHGFGHTPWSDWSKCWQVNSCR